MAVVPPHKLAGGEDAGQVLQVEGCSGDTLSWAAKPAVVPRHTLSGGEGAGQALQRIQEDSKGTEGTRAWDMLAAGRKASQQGSQRKQRTSPGQPSLRSLSAP